MSEMRPAGTLAEEVHAALRTDLLAGRFDPGMKLKLSEFGKRYGVSLSVVREAMARLAEQGLVVANPQRGFVVPPLNLEDLHDLTRTRVLVECAALRESISNGDLRWESRVVAAHHTLRGTSRGARRIDEEWSTAHRDFHHTLIEGCGLRNLVEIATDLRGRSEMFQYWASTVYDDKRDIAGEHQRITEASLDRDADRAVEQMRNHIELTSQVLAEILKAKQNDGSS